MKYSTKKIKRRVAAGAAAMAVTASMLVHTAVPDPSVLVSPGQTDEASPHVLHVEQTEHRSYLIETSNYEPLTVRERLTVWVQGLPLPVRVLLLLPLWAVGEALTLLLSLLWNSPAGQAVLHALLAFGVLLGLFALVWKLLFPNVPLKKMFTKRNMFLITLGAIVITAADRVLAHFWEPWKIWRLVGLGVVGSGVLALVWHRLLDKLPLPKRRRQRLELYVK